MKTIFNPLFIVIFCGISLTVFAQNETITHNLIKNSYMDVLDGPKPLGFETYSGSTLTLEAAHPYTKAFEGPYTSSAPSGASATISGATEQTPYWLGVYNKGSRANRGGLAGGWRSYPGGHILKITGDNSGAHAAVLFPTENNVLTNKVHLRGWLKIESGVSVSFGADAGYNHKTNGLTITKNTADSGTDGWYRIDEIVSISEMTNLSGLAFSMGIIGDSIEVYLALPHLSVIENESWMPSISDYLHRNGINTHSNTLSIGDIEIPTGYSLAVDGKAIVEEVRVELSDEWPDYVFESDYDLPTLAELEAFIQANRHLPEIPSAAIMEEEGIVLGEMNMLLLKKIEEITLHLIDLQKQVNTLKEENEQLKAKIE